MTSKTKEFWLSTAITVGTIVITSIITTCSQRSFISKAEENNLVRELVPLLISNDARQVDMALMILEENLSAGKYQGIKKIIDKKVEDAADEDQKRLTAPSVQQSKPPVVPKGSGAKNLPQNTSSRYAEIRPEWDLIVKARRKVNVWPLTKEGFLNMILSLQNSTSDKTLKGIATETAKAFNNEKYYKAYVGASWLRDAIPDSSKGQPSLLGITALTKNPDEKKAIEKLDIDSYLDELKQVYSFSNLVSFREETVKSSGEEVDMRNKKFLDELKKDGNFDWRPKPSVKQKNPLENIR